MTKNPAQGRTLGLSLLIVIGGLLLSPRSADAAGPTYYLSATAGPEAREVTLNWRGQ